MTAPSGPRPGSSVPQPTAPEVSLPTPTIDPRISERRSAVRRLNRRRRIRIALAVFGCAAAAGGTLAILHSPLTRVHQVSVHGEGNTSRQAVLGATRLDRHPLMIDVNTGRLERRLEALPWVGRATVARNWPSTVSISLRERVPAAVVNTTGGDWALIDATGRVLTRSGASGGARVSPPALRAPVPTLRGVDQLPAEGSQLSAASGSALRVLGALRPALINQVRSVDLLPNAEVALTLGTGVVVQLGDASRLSQELAATQAVLSQVGASSVRTIDVRVPEAPAVTRR